MFCIRYFNIKYFSNFNIIIISLIFNMEFKLEINIVNMYLISVAIRFLNKVSLYEF